ncbi:hypothetical protein HYH03_002118 [Edaphochlamys debaryana]|uniref:Uncharacterized protein n=1 Tax=Edaphochlamys debaryana TaxID=47281 RepID=A0A836C464_9CHLO|nr:hypothetical protein HYH03_002118 [Edaphochlamys debaryana]|eukprot:KAG2499826.1 hypothetical protein HYH03_002118 [Edaphochlamys debaryana]
MTTPPRSRRAGGALRALGCLCGSPPPLELQPPSSPSVASDAGGGGGGKAAATAGRRQPFRRRRRCSSSLTETTESSASAAAAAKAAGVASATAADGAATKPLPSPFQTAPPGLLLGTDWDSLSSSVPPSEAVFDLAVKGSGGSDPAAPPTAADGAASPATAASAPAGPASPSPLDRSGSILRPMAAPARSASGRHSSTSRLLSPSRSSPARLSRRPTPAPSPSAPVPAAASVAASVTSPSAAAASAAAATRTLSVRGPAAAGAGGGVSLRRAPSLAPSEQSSSLGGGSLLSVAFDRTRTAAPSDAALSDTASGRTSTSATTASGSLSPGSALASAQSLASAAAPATAAAPIGPAPTAGAPGKAAAAPAAAAATVGVGGAGAEGGSPAEAEALAAARGFAAAFLRALAAGDVKWGSSPAVGGLFAEDARMLTHDAQLFSGRTAIIRRLNAGMEQLHKMLGSLPPGGPADGEGGAGAEGGGGAAPPAADDARQAALRQVRHSLDVRLAPRAGAAGGAAPPARGFLARLFTFRRRGPAPARAASGGAASSSAASAGSLTVASGVVRVQATYLFEFGLRRFRLEDQFAVAQGRIVRLKRARG